MVIDTSAVLAMLFYEPECRSIAQAIVSVMPFRASVKGGIQPP